MAIPTALTSLGGLFGNPAISRYAVAQPTAAVPAPGKGPTQIVYPPGKEPAAAAPAPGKGPTQIVYPPGKEPAAAAPPLGSTKPLTEEQQLALDVERINALFGYSNPENAYRGPIAMDPFTDLQNQFRNHFGPSAEGSFTHIGRSPQELGNYGYRTTQIPGTDLYAGVSATDWIRGDTDESIFNNAVKWLTDQSPNYLQDVANFQKEYAAYGTPELRQATAEKNKALRLGQLWGDQYATSGVKSGGVYGDTLNRFIDELSRQYNPVYADAATSFASRGMSGSLGDIATMGELGKTYDRKKLDFTNRANSLVEGIAAKDEQTRQDIIGNLDASTDFTVAGENASNRLQANISDARHTADTTNLTNLFGDLGRLYDRQMEVDSFNRGYIPGGSGSGRGTSAYQGSIY